ncbi:MAG TPA: SCO family protein [Thermoanaerobaculia bacterium]|nr:SCO family protein [Thermoanaerobaculia bacterium]
MKHYTRLPLFAIAALLLAACAHESDLPRLFRVPDAALVADSGRPLRLSEMSGYVTVYDFIFTSCAGTCPVMNDTMRRLTERIDPAKKVRFVSISVDPERDTPEVLREYARNLRKDDRWIFATGGRDEIIRLSIEGFKLAAGGPPQSAAEPILHSTKFAVADRDGWIREYYSGTDPDAVEHLAATVDGLLRE